jgi:hypothetical protein
MRASSSVALAALCALGASGCARRFQPDAFHRGTSVAVVGVYTSPKVDYVRTYMAVGFGGQMDSRSDHVEIGPATAVLPDTRRVALRALASSGSFRLVPEDKVLGSRGYASVPAGATDVFTKDLIPARGYKPLYRSGDLGEAARRLKVDGAMTVSFIHSCVPGERGVVGRVFVGLGIVDQGGQYMWADYITKDSARAIPEGRPVTMEALRPLLVAAAEEGTAELLERLRGHLAAGR